MTPTIFKCQETGLNVQWEAEEIQQDGEGHGTPYEVIKCPACTRMHLLNISTGKLLGEE